MKRKKKLKTVPDIKKKLETYNVWGKFNFFCKFDLEISIWETGAYKMYLPMRKGSRDTSLSIIFYTDFLKL